MENEAESVASKSAPSYPLGLITGDVTNTGGNTAVGNNIQQIHQDYSQYYVYSKYVVQRGKVNQTAEVIRAVAQLVTSVGYIVALITSLLMLAQVVGMIARG